MALGWPVDKHQSKLKEDSLAVLIYVLPAPYLIIPHNYSNN